MTNMTRTTRVVAAGLFALTLGACERLREDLLSANDPDIINPSTINTAEAADALRIGAVARFRNITAGGESAWLLGGLMTDEWKSSDTFSQRNETDQRLIQDSNGNVQGAYREIYRVRTNAREALAALNTYKPTPTSNLGQMYYLIAMAEITLAENFCNGTPISEIVDGIPQYGPGLTNAEVFTMAIVHLDSALALTTGTDSMAVSVKNAAAIAKGRALVNLGRFTDAATAVTGVATTYQWRTTYSLNGGNNQIWSLNTSAKRWTVGDSFDVGGLITNALPFASAKDSRVPVSGCSILKPKPPGVTPVPPDECLDPAFTPQGKGFDTSTLFIFQTLWGRTDPTPVLTGVDARLIEAEAKLKAATPDIAGMMTILNTLRGTAQNLGIKTSSVMAALPTPATQDAAVALYFREKAFWQFGRGYRLSDLRRLVRQYGKTQAQVFPSGQWFKAPGATYGSDVNMPATVDEQNNPQFTGCKDRNA